MAKKNLSLIEESKKKVSKVESAFDKYRKYYECVFRKPIDFQRIAVNSKSKDPPCYIEKHDAMFEAKIDAKVLFENITKGMVPFCVKHKEEISFVCVCSQIPFLIAPCQWYNNLGGCSQYTTEFTQDQSDLNQKYDPNNEEIFENTIEPCSFSYPIDFKPIQTPAKCDICGENAIASFIPLVQKDNAKGSFNVCKRHADLKTGCKNSIIPFPIAICNCLMEKTMCKYYNKPKQIVSPSQQ